MISFFERQTTNVKGATLALEVIVALPAHRKWGFRRVGSSPLRDDGDICIDIGCCSRSNMLLNPECT